MNGLPICGLLRNTFQLSTARALLCASTLKGETKTLQGSVSNYGGKEYHSKKANSQEMSCDFTCQSMVATLHSG